MSKKKLSLLYIILAFLFIIILGLTLLSFNVKPKQEQVIKKITSDQLLGNDSNEQPK